MATTDFSPLSVDIPYLSWIVVYYKEKILNSKETLKQLINRNNELRSSIDMILLNVTRPSLKKLELAFKPGLSTVTWTSENLNDYFDKVHNVSFCKYIRQL